MKTLLKEIYNGFAVNPLAIICTLLVGGFCFIYNDLRNINAEQRKFLTDMQKTQQSMNTNLEALNIRLTRLEDSFTVTPQQLKELILLLHKQDAVQE